MSEKKGEAEIITWFDDFCFDCDIQIKSTDQKHKDHKRLQTLDESPPPLGIHVTDGLAGKDKVGG